MSEQTMPADTTATQIDTGITNEAATQDTAIDYDAELAAAAEKLETAERNRAGYAQRTQNNPALTAEVTSASSVEEQVKAALEKALPTFLPKMQATLAEDTMESVLNEIGSTDAEKKLIRFHFENSVGTNGTIRERLENAKLIANKKTILKGQREMAVALQNRQQISSSGLGSSTDGQQVADNFFTQDQLNALKARGWDIKDTKKLQILKSNMLKNRS